MSGHVDAIGKDWCKIKLWYNGNFEEEKADIPDHLEAVVRALESLKKKQVIESYTEIKAVGHRVVHGGEKYRQPTIIDEKVIEKIKELSELAPLHNPPNLEGILACRKILPHTPQIAVFDTAFHQTIPKHAFLYGIPYEFYVKYKIRKYGFHGISHKYISKQAAKLLHKKEEKCEMISCHLGNGSSITAIRDGKSVDTTMGFTPLDGILMGTRSGGMDPNIPLYLLKKKHYTVHEMEQVLNNRSGLIGITGKSDLREVRKMQLEGNEKAKLALKMLAYRISFYIGAYSTIIRDKLDCIVFTGGIGENAWYVREDILDSLRSIGIRYDKEKNKNNEIEVSTPESSAKVFIIPTNEEVEIAGEAYSIIESL